MKTRGKSKGWTKEKRTAAALKAWQTRRGGKAAPKKSEKPKSKSNKSKGGKKWGPGNPLYDWQQKQKENK
jgi:hypothetical protein